MAMIRFCRFVFVLMILGPIDAVAQPPSDDPVEGPWSGTAEVSLIATSGNSDTRTFGLGAEVTYDPGAWRWLGRISYVETDADDQLKARSESARVEMSRPLAERLEARKVIDRARGVLMDEAGLNEADAFRFIQQAAMNERASMVDVARQVLEDGRRPES